MLRGGVMRPLDQRTDYGLDPTALLIEGNRCGWSADFCWELAKRHARSGHIKGFLIWQKNAIRIERLMA